MFKDPAAIFLALSTAIQQVPSPQREQIVDSAKQIYNQEFWNKRTTAEFALFTITLIYIFDKCCEMQKGTQP